MNVHFLTDILKYPSAHSWRKVLTAAQKPFQAVNILTPYIIAEENHFLLVVKPFGWLSQPGISEAGIADIFKYYIAQKYGKKGNVFLAPAHRLDRPVCGLMVLARTSKGAQRLSKGLRHPQTEKIYTAIVHGKISRKSGEFHARGTKRKAGTSFRVFSDKNGEQYGVSYELILSNETSSLIKVYLKEGKFHEIRFTLSENGFPIKGDTKYSGIADKNSPGLQNHEKSIALIATGLSYPHPTENDKFVSHSLELPKPHELLQLF